MAVRILIADDSVAVRNALHHSLSQQNDWTICGEADNGCEAIARASETAPDLIILDFSMPVMNGLEAARILKKVVPAVPVVMFTSYETSFLDKDVAAAGIDRVISKSEPVQKLVHCIRSLLPKVA